MHIYHYTPEINRQSIVDKGLCASLNCNDTTLINEYLKRISLKVYEIRNRALFFFNIAEEERQDGILEVSVEYSKLTKSHLYVADLEQAEYVYTYARGVVNHKLLQSYAQQYISTFRKVRKVEDLWRYTSTEIIYNKDIPTSILRLS